MKKVSAKQRMLQALKKNAGKNAFTTKQAEQRFGIANVTARISELRQEGHAIVANRKGSTYYYQLVSATKSFKQKYTTFGTRV